MARAARPREETKSERIEFRVTPERAARLDEAAQRMGVDRSTYVNRELAPVLDTGIPFLVQIRLFFLQMQHEATLTRLEAACQEIEHTKALIEARKGGILAADVPHLERRVASLERTRAKEARRAAELQGEIEALRSPARHGIAPSRASAIFALPIFVAISTAGATGVTLFVLSLIGMIVIGGAWYLKRRRRARTANQKTLAPVIAGPPTDQGVGVNPQEILYHAWTYPPNLWHRLKVMLEREDGLDRLRMDFEDADLEYIDDEGETEHVHFIVVTDDEWALLPLEFQLATLSKRSRRALPPNILRGIASEKDAKEEAVEVETGIVTPAPDAPQKKKRGRPSNAERAARAAASAPPVLPHQPPHMNGNGNGNGNGDGHGAAAASGGGTL